MSLKEYFKKKSQSLVEFQIHEYRDDLLANLSSVLLNKKEQAQDLIFESINCKKLRDYCESINYLKFIEFEISLRSKNISKILEHLHDLEQTNSKLVDKNTSLLFDEIKNNIFNYILKSERKNFDSTDIDLILENNMLKLEDVLQDFAFMLKKFNFKETNKIILKPLYDPLNHDAINIYFSVNKDQEPILLCRAKENSFTFEELSTTDENVEIQDEIKKLLEYFNQNKKNAFYETYFFEYPKEQREKVNFLKKEVSWGYFVNLPPNIRLLENCPNIDCQDIWKIKRKNDKVIWIERVHDAPTEKN